MKTYQVFVHKIKAVAVMTIKAKSETDALLKSKEKVKAGWKRWRKPTSPHVAIVYETGGDKSMLISNNSRKQAMK